MPKEPTDKLWEELKKVVTDQLGVNDDQVVPGAKTIDDLGADSLDNVELVMAIEETFDISIPEEDAEKCNTIGDYYNLIKSKKGME